MPRARRRSMPFPVPMVAVSTLALSVALLWGGVGPAHAQLGALDGALEEAITAPEPGAAGEAPASDGAGESPMEGEAGAGGEKPGLPALVSEFCAFSFFTNGGDSVDLRGSTGFGCVDTGAGRDVVELRPGDFAQGLEIFSGRGRSVFRLPDSDVMVFDAESTAEEIRTGRGNDTIRLGIGFAESGRVVRTPETRVFPGLGDNLVVVGSGRADALGARHSPNARIFPEGGTLAVEAGCGREADLDSLDVVVENAEVDTRVSIASKGCGVAVRNHAAPTVWEQEGGRMVVLLRPSGEEGSTSAFFEAYATRGAGLSFAAIEPHPETVLDWQGMGDATLQVDSYSTMSGGSYKIEAGGMVFARVVTRDVAAGGQPPSLLLDLGSAVAVEAVLEGDGADRIGGQILAPEVRITWRPMGAHRGPVLALGESRRIEARGIEDGIVVGGDAGTVVALENEAGSVPLADVDPYAPPATPSPVEGDSQTQAEAEPMEAEAVPPGEAGSEAVEAPRDLQGRTEAGRLSLLGGFPPGSEVPAPSDQWAWRSSGVSVEADRVVLTIEAPSSWCTRIGVEGAMGSRMADCGASASWDMGDQRTVRIETPDGVHGWSIPGLDKAAVVELNWSPTR